MRVRLVTPGLFNHVLWGKCGGGRELCEDRAIAGVEKVVCCRWARLGNAARKHVWRRVGLIELTNPLRVNSRAIERPKAVNVCTLDIIKPQKIAFRAFSFVRYASREVCFRA